MTLAADDIIVTIDGEAIRLRRTLRAAIRLERQFGGFAELLRLLADGSATACAAVLREHVESWNTIPDAIAAWEGSLHNLHLSIAPHLIEHVFHLAGGEAIEDAKPKAKTSKPGMTHAAYFEHLFGLGTGALGWPADKTLDTAPAEIEAAYAGRVALLSALYGGTGKDDTKGSATLPTNDERRIGLAELQAMG